MSEFVNYLSREPTLELLLKGAIGAFMVIVISLLSTTRVAFLSGLLPLFPTFALIAHIISYNAGGGPVLKSVIAFGLLSMIPYASYLLTLLFTVDTMSFQKAVGCSLFAWLVASVIIFSIWTYVQPKFS